MTQINPFLGIVSPNPAAVRSQAGDKARQMRRAAQMEKSTASPEDSVDLLGLEEPVESADQVDAANDQAQKPPQRDKSPRKKKDETDTESEESHIDFTA
jgi:hypothetical protein